MCLQYSKVLVMALKAYPLVCTNTEVAYWKSGIGWLQLQKGFPKDLFAVRMYAILPQPRTVALSATQAMKTRRRANQPRKIQ